jgi:hypothetical protein
MTLRIGDRVMVASQGKPPIYHPAMRGVLVDIKWNLGLVKFSDDTTDWYPLKRIHKNDTTTPKII